MDQTPICKFQLSSTGTYQCPHVAENHNLCIFHVLAMGEMYPDHSYWKLSASIPSLEHVIQEKFSKLLDAIENDPACSLADFRGFRLPSLRLNRTLTKEVRFDEARFYGRTSFSHASFEKEAHFSHAVFAGKTEFYKTTFKSPPVFLNVRFEGDTYFVEGACHGGAIFGASTISRRLEFTRWFFGGICGFSSLRREKDAFIRFDNVRLDQASFLGTQLEPIEFDSVTWSRDHNGRNMLRDEAFWASGQDVEALAANYRQLVLNYERKRDFDTAEDFHFHEMEMRTKATELKYTNLLSRWLQVGPYRLYRVFSDYGASWNKAFCWLLIWLVLIFPLAFMFAGFQRVEPRGDRLRVIQYVMSPDVANTVQWISDYSESVAFSLSVATFHRVRLYEPAGPVSYFLMNAGSVIFTAQTALLLLALRRRFRR